jgi:aspartyl-tRNA synthetase
MKRTMILATVDKVGEEVWLKGWVHTRRDMGKLAFIDMRDRSGLAQVVFVPAELDDASKELMKQLRPEFCIAVRGIVNTRGAKQVNESLPTGKVEVLAKELIILNEAKTPPFELEDTSNINEELRLKYRYLDLRSPRMLKNLVLRDNVIRFFREFLHHEGFLEIETPILTKGTPEGSREYLVPSRLHAGEFYVLPQSPQQFKQLSMVGGLERYFQIARCFRDEDQRGDRQPEFTQLDLEMSFVDQEDVLALNERMFIEMVKTVTPEKHITQMPFPRITYAESMEKYGSDKPDLRKDKNDPNELAFCWIVDFPMFEKTDDGIQAAHHPFCMPNPEDLHLLESEPLKVRAASYDLVLNGYELSSGSIRIHQRELQNKIFEMLGLPKELIQARFGHMLEAFEFGAPPHGGMAPGIDRIVMILANEPNIREVIAYPKTGDARDLLMGAPSEIEEKRLEEAHIKIRK